jgi:exo-beta-1,3-glucanase (GH17 family)/cellulose synthase/poly-beta-1,6-N-acetylglucosamine synthase-like glycosyltransferase
MSTQYPINCVDSRRRAPALLPGAFLMRFFSPFQKMGNRSWTILAVILVFNFVIWTGSRQPAPTEPDWTKVIKNVSFSPYRNDQDPYGKRYPTHEQIRDDMRFLKGKVESVRTYSSLNGLEIVPGLAAAHGMRIAAGAWLDRRLVENEKELANLISNANRYHSIDRVIVGNEAVLRSDVSVKQLIHYLDRVRGAVKVPVSTAEPWHVWLKYPELAEHVDYIAIHVLPYWERVGLDDAVPWVMDCYNRVRTAFPGKPVWLAEVGWPSHGVRNGAAKPSLLNASVFIRRFLNLADRENLDYCIMEAFDQSWKGGVEGRVGAYWGLFDGERRDKVIMQGPLKENLFWLYQALTALLGLWPVALYLRHRRNNLSSSRLFFAVLLQATACVMVWFIYAPICSGFLLSEMVIWAFLLPMQLGLIGVVLVNGAEMSDMLWQEGLKRRFTSVDPFSPEMLPPVSIHVAICSEPPEMVRQTLDSLAALDYPDFEVLVIDNNTSDPALWQPVEQHCARMGNRFRFFHLPVHPGFKAGALNFALEHTDPRCEVVAVVDSDYVVRPDWLKALVPHFKRPEVAVVQAPQDHRQWEGDMFKTMCNWEYHGFFAIGMVYRNEHNAIIQHGTMTLIRRNVLDPSRWSEWCICEDAELGLRILAQGYEAVYVPESFGQGLTPDSFAGYKRQRFRWAYGAVQILKRHSRLLFSVAKRGALTRAQRYHFVAGWLPWFADALHYVITWIWIFWAVAMMAWPEVFGPPLSVFLYPVMGAFLFRLVHFVALYRSRVNCSLLSCLGAALAGQALTPTIARAVISGLFTSDRPFMRTPKCENRPALAQAFLMAREEVVMMLMLVLVALQLTMGSERTNPDALLWAGVILVHSLPYVSAAVMAALSVRRPDALRAPRSFHIAGPGMSRPVSL